MENKDQNHQPNVDYYEDLTGDIPKPKKEVTPEVGARIKSLRIEKGLSLHELSNLTGFDVEQLAKIETNKIQPKLGTIIRLSKALDSAFTRLVSGVGDRLYAITRKNERKTVFRSTSPKRNKPLYTYKSLAPEVKGRHMEALVVQLEDSSDKEMSVHEGEEFIYVLDGVVKLMVDKDTFELEPGDSVYYLSTIPHLISPKEERATVLAVIYEGS